MCIIIAKDKGVEPLDAGYFERAWNHNGDGGGIVWKSPDNEDAHVQKGFMKKEDMLEKLKEINTKENSFIAHFRIRSVGDKTAENTHPFVMNRVTFAHNGTITSLQPLEGKTDSETFGLAFLKNRSMKWIKENQLLLELALGSSKFAIMDNKSGEILILNKEKGKEQDGAWFSNSSADKPTPVPARSNIYDYSDYDYSRYYKGANDVGFIKARAFFGTKSFTESFGEWSKEEGCWIYTSSKNHISCYPFDDNLCIGRNGLWKFDKAIRPIGFDFEQKHYQHKAPEFKMIGNFQRKLQKALAFYHQSKFDYNEERSDAEKDLCAMNIVLDSARRFIADAVELNQDNLTTFVLSNVMLSGWSGQYQKQTYEYFVELLEEYIVELTEGQPVLLV